MTIAGFSPYREPQFRGFDIFNEAMDKLKDQMLQKKYGNAIKAMEQEYSTDPQADTEDYWRKAEALRGMYPKNTNQVNPFEAYGSDASGRLTFPQRMALKNKMETKVGYDAQGNPIIESKGNIDPNKIYQENMALRNKQALTEDSKKLATQKMMAFQEANPEAQRAMLKDIEKEALKNGQRVILNKGVFSDNYEFEDAPLDERYKKIRGFGWNVPQYQLEQDIEEMKKQGYSVAQIKQLLAGQAVVSPEGVSTKLSVKDAQNLVGGDEKQPLKPTPRGKSVEYIKKYGLKVAREKLIKEGNDPDNIQ